MCVSPAFPVARAGVALGGPGGCEGRPGTPRCGRLPVEASGGHTGAGSCRRPGLLGTRLHGPGPISAPGEPHPPGWGAARPTGVRCSRGLGWGWDTAKLPGAAGRHEPRAGLRPPPGRAPSSRSRRVRAAPRARHARACARVRRRAGPDAQASEPRPPPPRTPVRAGPPPLLRPCWGPRRHPGSGRGPGVGGRRTPQTHPGRRAEPGPQGYGNSPCPTAPSLCGDPKGPAPRPELRQACHPLSSCPALRWDPRPPLPWGRAWWDRCLRARKWALPGAWLVESALPRGDADLRDKGDLGPISASAQAKAGLKCSGVRDTGQPGARCCRPGWRPQGTPPPGSLTNEDSRRPLGRVCG